MARSEPWFRSLTASQRRALLAAMLGWMFDSMDASALCTNTASVSF